MESQLGIDGWSRNLEIERIDSSSVHKTWHPVYGERAVVEDCYKEYNYTLKIKGRGSRLALIVRAYNSGIGFRYKYLGSSICVLVKKKRLLSFLKILTVGLHLSLRQSTNVCW